MMKLTLISTMVASATAFAPSTPTIYNTALQSSDIEQDQQVIESPPQPDEIAQPAVPSVQTINGWAPDDSLPCFGLPGVVAPTGFFDPLGFSRNGISLNEVKRNREAEVMHGRVAMIASVGYLAGEAVSGPFNIVGPANDQLQQMPTAAFVLLTAAIASAELKRATTGWVEPSLSSWTKTLWTLRDNYYPGDLGFDPLGLKPTDAKAFADMQTRELQNGRLAMIGVAGMCAQELVNHRGIFETFDFYNKVFNGINPYEACGDAIIC